MAAIDLFEQYKPGLTAPAPDAEEVTPSDDTDLTYVTRAVWVGGEGDLEVIMASGSTVVYHSVPAGTLLPIRVSRVKAGNTTATNIVAVW